MRPGARRGGPALFPAVSSSWLSAADGIVSDERAVGTGGMLSSGNVAKTLGRRYELVDRRRGRAASPTGVLAAPRKEKLVLEANRRPSSLVDVKRGRHHGPGGDAVTAGRRACLSVVRRSAYAEVAAPGPRPCGRWAQVPVVTPRQNYPSRRPSTRQLCPADLV